MCRSECGKYLIPQKGKNRHRKYIYIYMFHKYMWICSVNKMVPKYFHIRVYFHPDQEKLLDSKMTQEVWQGFVWVECGWKCGQIRWLARSGRWWQLDGAWLWRKGSLPCEKCSRWWWVYVRVTEKQIISLLCSTYARKAGGGLAVPLGWLACGGETDMYTVTSESRAQPNTKPWHICTFNAAFVFTLVWFLGEFNTYFPQLKDWTCRTENNLMPHVTRRCVEPGSAGNSSL